MSLGSSAATVVTFVNSTTITATTPAGAAGSVNVTVTNPDGQSGTLSNAFAYSATAPTVSNVSPNTGALRQVGRRSRSRARILPQGQQ